MSELVPRDDAADIEALRIMARDFAAGLNDRDVGRIMRFYGAQYVDVNLRHPVQTFAERRSYYDAVVHRGNFEFKVDPEEIRIEGRFAFVRGTIEIRDRDVVGEASARVLRYLEIAAKQPNGEWNVIWGMDGPIQETAMHA